MSPGLGERKLRRGPAGADRGVIVSAEPPPPAPLAEPSSEPSAEREGGAARAFAAIRGLAGLTMISRVLGFVRDMMMATALGAGLTADAFFLAWMIPNLFRRLFGDGAFSAALVPVFIEARESGDHEGARDLVSAALWRLVAGLGGLVLILELGCVLLSSEPGAELLGQWVQGAALVKLTLVFDLLRFLLPYLVLICSAGLLGGALNALDRFSVPAWAQVAFNLVWIGGLFLAAALYEDTLARVRCLALCLLFGGAVQLLLHAAAMGRAGVPLVRRWQTEPERLARVRGLFFSLALGLALFQLNALFDGLIAYAFVAEGGVSSLYYGNRLVQLPIGVLGVALSTAVFPQLTRLAKRGDFVGLGHLLDRGVLLGAYVALPAAAGLAALAGPIVSTLFERGHFDATSAARTARVVLCLTPAIVAACVTPVVTRAFYAEEEVHTPVRVGAACVLLNLLLNLLLVGPFGEAGLALATSSSQSLNLILQAWLYRRRRVARGDVPASFQTLARGAGYTLLALGMGVAAWAVERYAPGPAALRLLLAILSGVAIYAGVSAALKVEPLRLLLSRGRAA